MKKSKKTESKKDDSYSAPSKDEYPFCAPKNIKTGTSDGKKTFWIDEGWPERVNPAWEKKVKRHFNDKRVRKEKVSDE